MSDDKPTCLRTAAHGPHYVGGQTFCIGTGMPPYTCDKTDPHSRHGWINSDKTTGHCPGVSDAPAEQPPPTPTGGPAIADLVIADMAARKQLGISRYGVPLQAHNGRDALRDAYEEALDLACYLRQAIAERDSGEGVDPCEEICHPEHGACCGGQKPRPHIVTRAAAGEVLYWAIYYGPAEWAARTLNDAPRGFVDAFMAAQAAYGCTKPAPEIGVPADA